MSESPPVASPHELGPYGELIEQFRERLTDFFEEHKEAFLVREAKLDDRVCCRFIKARPENLDAAIKMFQTTVLWRKSANVDNFADWRFDADEIKKYYSHYYHKEDKLHRPVYVDASGSLRISELMKVTTHEEMVRFHVHSCEYLASTLLPETGDRSLAAGSHFRQYQCTTIVDLEGMGLSSFSKEAYNFTKAISVIDQDNYPENLGVLFVVNAPWVFKTVWRVVRPWLNERTQKKIHLFRSPEEWKPRLLELISPENLPVKYGGSCVCPGGCEKGAPNEVAYRRLATEGVRPRLHPSMAHRARPSELEGTPVRVDGSTSEACGVTDGVESSASPDTPLSG